MSRRTALVAGVIVVNLVIASGAGVLLWPYRVADLAEPTGFGLWAGSGGYQRTARSFAVAIDYGGCVGHDAPRIVGPEIRVERDAYVVRYHLVSRMWVNGFCAGIGMPSARRILHLPRGTR